MSLNGSTRAWRTLRAQVIREEPLCWLRLPGCTHLSTTADHVIPLAVRPDLRYVRANLRGACSRCNYRRGHMPVAQLDQLRYAPTQYDNEATSKTTARQDDSPALRFFRT